VFFNRRVPFFVRESYLYDSKSALLWGAFWGLSLAFFPVIARKIGASSFQIALLTSAPFLGSLFSLYWSRLSTRTGKMKFFILVKILARATIFLMFFAIKPWIFIAVVFLNALLEQAGSPAYTGIMKEIYPDSFRGRVMGYVAGQQGISAIIACYLTGFLLDRMSYRILFPVAAIIGIFSLAYFGKIKTKNENKIENPKKQGVIPLEARDVFRKDRSFFHYSLVFFVYGFGGLLAMPLYPLFLVDVLHVSNTLMGKLASISSFFWMLSYFFWGRYIDEKGEIKSFIIAFLLASLIPLFYAISFNLWFIVLASVISGFNIGSELVRINYIAKIAKHEDVQTYQAIDFSLMGIRGITAPFLGVALMNLFGIRVALLISFVVSLVAFVLMSWFATHYSGQGMRNVLASRMRKVREVSPRTPVGVGGKPTGRRS